MYFDPGTGAGAARPKAQQRRQVIELHGVFWISYYWHSSCLYLGEGFMNSVKEKCHESTY